MNKSNPPKLAERFFRWICAQSNLEGLEGDLYELYERRAKKQGHRKANWYYLLDMLTLMRGSVVQINFNNSKSNKMGMILNYIKIAFRNGLRRKSFTLINLFGLTLGITAVLFISVYLWEETHYDRYQTNGENKYRLYDRLERESGDVSLITTVPPPIAEALEANFSQIKKAGRIYFDYGGTVFQIGDKSFSETNGYYAEFDALDILDVEIIAGTRDGLKEPRSFILSESLFIKFFEGAPFNNQTVQLGSSTFSIVGVYKDFPDQSHVNPDYLVSFELLKNYTPEERMNSWLWHQFTTYVEFEDGVNVKAFEEEAQRFVKERSAKELEAHGISYTTHFQSFHDIHLHSSAFEQDTFDRSSYQNVFFLGIAALIILFIACLNFVNLTSAQAIGRAKEVGIRKFVGAGKGQVFVQHCIESLLYVLIAGALTLGLLFVLLPEFNQFTEKEFELVDLFTPPRILAYLGALVALGVLAGAYPATLLTRVRAIDIVHGLKIHRVKVGKHFAVFNPRQILVAVQYVLSVGLIIISVVVYEQFQFMREADLGFDKENLILISTVGSMRRDLESTRQAFSEYSNIKNITFSYSVPGGIVAGDGIIIPRLNNKDQSANVFVTDHQFLKTMELELIAGRDFKLQNASDHSQAFVLNEEAVRTFDLGNPEDAIGEVIHWKHWNHQDSLKKGKVIGVVRDFNVKSMHKEVSPAAIHLLDSYMPNMIVRIGNGDLKKTIEFLEEKYSVYAPQRPFEFTFLDQTFDDFYRKEEKMAQLFGLFTVLTIVTALIGLLGLVNFNINKRSKELSIRKILGAGRLNIYVLLVKKYIFLICISLMISTPIAYYMANGWLDDFAYRITLDALIFIKVLGLILCLTLIVVSWRAIKGLQTNPADKLRTE
ncbi:MAG: ABC transporter permease [Ekhidna sp.]